MEARNEYTSWSNNAHPQWWKDKGLRRIIMHMAALYMCVFTWGYDWSLLNGLQIVPAWGDYFGNPAGQDLGLIAASFYFPQLVFGPLSAYISDKFGRRVALFIGAALSVIGVLLQTFAKTRGQFIGGRVILGSGSAVHLTLVPPMIQELAHPRLRSVLGASFLSTFFVGSIIAAFVCLGTIDWVSEWAWRLPTILQIISSLVVVVYIGIGLMPESPRFLARAGKEDQALKILADLHANGDINDELVRHEMLEIQTTLALEDEGDRMGYMTFLKTADNRRRALITIVIAMGQQLGGNNLTSYYFGPILKSIGITSPAQQAGISAGLSIWGLISCLACAQLVDRVGRRPLWLYGLSGMLITFSVITALSAAFAETGSKAIGLATIPFFFFFSTTNIASFTCIGQLYIVEINPYALRSRAMSLNIFAQGVAFSFNQYVNPIALDAIAWKYYFVFIGVQIFLIVFAYFFFLETKGYTIEEVAKLFDRNSGASSERTEALDGESKRVELEESEHVDRLPLSAL